jgi:hypothetical protein
MNNNILNFGHGWKRWLNQMSIPGMSIADGWSMMGSNIIWKHLILSDVHIKRSVLWKSANGMLSWLVALILDQCALHSYIRFTKGSAADLCLMWFYQNFLMSWQTWVYAWIWVSNTHIHQRIGKVLRLIMGVVIDEMRVDVHSFCRTDDYSHERHYRVNRRCQWSLYDVNVCVFSGLN